MANIYVQDCSDTSEQQKWTIMSDGRIALDGSSPRKQLSQERSVYPSIIRANPLM